MTLGKNIVWSFIENLLRIIAAFFVNIFIARHLGPAHYGVLTTAFVTVNLVSAFAGLGLDPCVIRELSVKRKSANIILGSAFLLRTASSLLAVIILILWAAFSIDSFDELKNSAWGAIIILLFLVPLQPVAFGMGNLFTANLRADLLTFSKTTGLFIGTLLRIIGLTLGFSFLYFALCHVLEHAVSTLIVRIKYLKNFKEKTGKWESDKETVSLLIDGGKWLFLSAIVVTLIQGAGVLILKALSTPEETGVYAAALRLVMVLQFIPAIICKTFLPVVISKKEHYGKEEAEKIERELFKLLWLFGYSVACFFLLWGDVITPVILGEEYKDSIMPLKILAIMLIPLSVGAARTVYFAKDRAYNKIMIADVTGAFFTVLLGCLFVRDYGAKGAAMASLIASVIGYLLVPYAFLERGKKSQKIVLKSALLPFPNFKMLFRVRN